MPGAMVRYGGMKAGKVDGVRVDPKDSTRIEIDFRVRPGIPVKTDSVAKISALGALSDNYVEVGTGTKNGQLAPPGSELKSAETLGIGDLGDMIGGLTPIANQRYAEPEPAPHRTASDHSPRQRSAERQEPREHQAAAWAT